MRRLEFIVGLAGGGPRNRFFRWHGIGHHLVGVGPTARLLRRRRYKHHLKSEPKGR